MRSCSRRSAGSLATSPSNTSCSSPVKYSNDAARTGFGSRTHRSRCASKVRVSIKNGFNVGKMAADAVQDGEPVEVEIVPIKHPHCIRISASQAICPKRQWRNRPHGWRWLAARRAQPTPRQGSRSRWRDRACWETTRTPRGGQKRPQTERGQPLVQYANAHLRRRLHEWERAARQDMVERLYDLPYVTRAIWCQDPEGAGARTPNLPHGRQANREHAGRPTGHCRRARQSPPCCASSPPRARPHRRQPAGQPNARQAARKFSHTALSEFQNPKSPRKRRNSLGSLEHNPLRHVLGAKARPLLTGPGGIVGDRGITPLRSPPDRSLAHFDRLTLRRRMQADG